MDGVQTRDFASKGLHDERRHGVSDVALFPLSARRPPRSLGREFCLPIDDLEDEVSVDILVSPTAWISYMTCDREHANFWERELFGRHDRGRGPLGGQAQRG